MQHGIVITSGDPCTAAELAADAEAAGWTGAFTWDAIAIGEMDAWVGGNPPTSSRPPTRGCVHLPE